MSWEAWGDPPEPPEMETCPICNGAGWIKHRDGDGTNDDICDYCNGEGEIERPDVRFDDDII